MCSYILECFVKTKIKWVHTSIKKRTDYFAYIKKIQDCDLKAVKLLLFGLTLKSTTRIINQQNFV